MSEPSALNVRQGFSAAMSIGSAGMLCALACLALGGCGFSFGGSVSDVPCLDPRAWSYGAPWLLFRPATSDGGALLLTHQTDAQIVEDDVDDIIGNGPHESVYRYEPESQIFELVDLALWDSAEGRVIRCLGGPARDTPFASRKDHLEFEGRRIEVAGNYVVDLLPARSHPFVGVLSSDGGGGVPFLSSRRSSGQHYHEVFSEQTGLRVAGPVRIGMTGDSSSPQGCWSEDEHLIVYAQVDGGRIPTVCIVDVSELLEVP